MTATTWVREEEVAGRGTFDLNIGPRGRVNVATARSRGSMTT
jgi:hypothetical protein